MQKSFKRSFESLPDVFKFLEHSFDLEKIDRRHFYAICLAAEELFTNMIKYDRGGNGEITISFLRLDDRLELSLTDSCGEPFDVTLVKPVDINAPLEKRTRGGLGLHLIRQTMDAVAFKYENRQSRVTVTKRLE